MALGVAGLTIITYFYYHTESAHLALGELQHTVSPYTMPLPMRLLLFALEASGVILGYFAYRDRYVKLGLLGIGLCTLCLILLYGYTF